MKDELGKRMKENYENRAKNFLTRRVPVIIRLDGKAFHTFTKGLARPFDSLLMETMQETAKYLCENIQGCKLAYTQSDEISLLITDYDKLTTDAWFDYGVQKIVSVSASMATLAFNKIFKNKYYEYVQPESINLQEVKYWEKVKSKIDKALFDSRVFSLPKEEVCNYFIWRQQDCTKNSITMVAQSYFSHKELHCKNGNDKQDMLMLEKGVNWNNFSTPEKRGTCIIKQKIKLDNGAFRDKFTIDREIPIFSKNREYIESLI